MRRSMMLEKVVLGVCIVGTRGGLQLWGSLAVTWAGFAFYAWKKPMLDTAEDFTEIISRGSNAMVVLLAMMVEYDVIPQGLGQGFLATVSGATMAVFLLTLGPMRMARALVTYARKRAAASAANAMSEATIYAMVEDEVRAMDQLHFDSLSAAQQHWMMSAHGPLVIAAEQVRHVIVKGEILPLQEPYSDTALDLSGTGLDANDVALVADWLASPGGAAIAHVALSSNMITGSTNVGYSEAKYDSDLSGIIALGEAVVISKTLTSIDLSQCGISVA
eukprot:COSAG01_NODE_18863_length_1048_cov_1.116965_1_plen_275_part_10